jgi:hypothetical protein
MKTETRSGFIMNSAVVTEYHFVDSLDRVKAGNVRTCRERSKM